MEDDVRYDFCLSLCTLAAAYYRLIPTIFNLLFNTVNLKGKISRILLASIHNFN